MIARARSQVASATDYTLDPDVRLMLEVRAGSTRAFEELFRKHRPSVMAMLHRQLGPSDQVEDLAQEVFLRVYRARTNYRPKARFTTWLFTITRRVALNAVTSIAASQRMIHIGDATREGSRGIDELVQVSADDHPAQQLQRSETIRQVQRAVNALCERQRTIMILARFENYSYREIADRVGLSPSSVKSHAARARAVLRAKLSRYVQA